MKKCITILLIGGFLSLSLISKAQQFWIENWTGATAQGQISYTGTNGVWEVVQSGYNGVDSNVWYFSNWEEGMGRGVCGAGQTGPATAHMGFTTNSPLDWPIYQGLDGATNPDQGAVIDDDHHDPTRTNLRLESPIINCTGKSSIQMSFNYIMGNSDHNDSATVVYSSDGGTTWSLLASPAPTNNGSCSGEGFWTYYSVSLPASANNNPNVKIGFNWTNDTLEYDDSAFDNTFTPIVSFAVDSVVLKTVPPVKPVVGFKANKTTGCAPDTINFTDTSSNTPTSWKWTFTGGNPATSTSQNQQVIYAAPGSYAVKLVVTNGGGSDSITKASYINVVGNCGAGIENIADNNNISLYPNPANNTVNLSFNKAISGNATVDIMDITGRVITSHLLNASAGKIMTMDVSGMVSGVYIVKVTTGSNIYFDKFIKQ